MNRILPGNLGVMIHVYSIRFYLYDIPDDQEQPYMLCYKYTYDMYIADTSNVEVLSPGEETLWLNPPLESINVVYTPGMLVNWTSSYIYVISFMFCELEIPYWCAINYIYNTVEHYSRLSYRREPGLATYEDVHE